MTVSGANTYGIFSIPGSETGVAINGLAMVNGSSGGNGGAILANSALTVTNSAYSGNSAGGSGGAIFANSTLTVSNSTFSSNSTSGVFSIGGAIVAEGALAVTNSTFSGNSGGSEGGAIVGEDTLTVSNSTFSGNSASDGGAIYANATLTVTNCTFSGHQTNHGGNGGAIYASSTLTVNNSTFSGNSSYGSEGGAIYAYSTLTVTNSTFLGNASSYGGAILAGYTGTVTNSTFSGNSGGVWGGAIFSPSVFTTLTVTNSTFSGNSGGQGGAIFAEDTLTVSNNIFMNNQAGSDPGIYTSGGGTSDHNLFYGGDGCTGCSSNTNAVSGNPNLAPLGSYGGPTQTMLPLPVSAAICAGSTADAAAVGLTTDQRGINLDPNCPAGAVDIGAVQTGYALTGSFSLPSPIIRATTLPTQTFTVSEIGGNLPAGNATITVSDAASDLGASTTSATNASNGQAAFSNLSFAAPESTDTLTATLALNPALTPALALTIKSNSFQVGNLTQATLKVTGPSSLTYGTTTTVTASGGSGTGALSFSAGSSTGCSLSGTTLSVTNASGTCSLTATKAADSNYNQAVSAAFPVTLVKANSTTTATFTTTQTVTGTTATLTTKVTPQYAGTPTGTVTYSLDIQGKTTTLGTSAVGAIFTTPVLPAGADTVIAVYNGDNNFNSSGQAVYPTGVAPTPVSLSLGSNAVYYPFAAGYTITIPTQSGKALSGTVTVYSGTSVIATISVPSYGVINAFTQLALPVGTYKLQAVYSGNSVYPPGESPVETLSIVPLL